jgi:peptidoglycan hydrolase-like protein with peptidoglycan-binding domain
MDLLTWLTIAIAVYAFAFRPAHTRRVADKAADGAAPGARNGLPVTVDGVYGQDTADAVMAFQEQEQFTVHGAVGLETAEALGIWSG